jgi:hypothetical protein
MKTYRVSIVVLLLTLWTMSVDAAYPRLLMVYGQPLTKPVVVEDPLEVVKIFQGSSDGTDQESLARRPYLDLALFWGEEWNRYMDQGKPTNVLRPEDVTPFGNIPIRGRFYPACADAAAQISVNGPDAQGTGGIWKVPAEGLSVLESLGVPTRDSCKKPQ